MFITQLQLEGHRKSHNKREQGLHRLPEFKTQNISPTLQPSLYMCFIGAKRKCAKTIGKKFEKYRSLLLYQLVNIYRDPLMGFSGWIYFNEYIYIYIYNV